MTNRKFRWWFCFVPVQLGTKKVWFRFIQRAWDKECKCWFYRHREGGRVFKSKET